MIRIPLDNISRSGLEERYAKTAPIYEGYLGEAAVKFYTLLRNSSIKASVKQRIKSFDSLFYKILRKAKELNGAAEGNSSVLITDLIGIRVICPFLEDTLKVEDLIRRNFEIFERERKGEEFSPREFGYESTHLIIKIAGPKEIEGVLQEDILCEIQIRTILQDAWAEVEHELMYKAEFTPFDEPLRRKLAAVNANLSLSDIIFQEIRDYQRRLQEELKKRRKSFLQKLQSETEELRAADLETDIPERVPKDAVTSPTVETLDNLLLEALTAHNTRRYPEAIAIYGRILSRHPKKSLRSIIHIHRGMAYFGESRYHEALDDFTRALTLDDKNARAYYYRGVVLRFLKDNQRALSDFDKCIEIDPYQFDPIFARAQVFFGLGDYIRAYEECSKALTIKPKVVEAQRFQQVVLRRLQF